VFISIKNHIDCVELWVDEVFEIIAVEVKGRDPRRAWEIVGIYRAPNENMRYRKPGNPSRYCRKFYKA
jgi:hypothetical protein